MQWFKRLVKGVASIVILTMLAVSAQAKDVPLSNEPVLDSTAAEPNIMLFIDSSGSMSSSVSGTGQTRLQVAQQAAIELVNELTNVRIGLSIFNGSVGARILVGIDDISSNKTTMINQINNIRAGGNTPLAEATYQIGRYLVQGHNGTLVLHPDQTNETRQSAYTTFSQQPRYDRGVNQNSPIQAFCQKSFIIMLTDGEPTSDTNIPYSSGLRDYYPQGNSSFFLDDVVNALFDIDLRPDLQAPDNVTKKNNVVTYPVGFIGANESLMRTVAQAGGGEYFDANNSDELTAAFNSATAAIISGSSTAAATSFSTLSLTEDTTAYVTLYNTNSWSGNVIAYDLDSQGDLDSIDWEAAKVLDNTLPGSRVILTYNRDNFRGVSFKRYSDLSQLQQDDLKVDGNAQLGQDRIDYLRGDRSNEGDASGDFRKRASVLGDIVNSATVYVAEPISNWPDTAPFPTGSNKYSNYEAAQKNRTPMIYVGANDGMLHGFAASNGAEQIAYIPDSVFSTSGNAGLHYLTDTDYEHRFYVDGTPIVSDAYIKTTPSGSVNWHTILVGRERNGGAGYFALDITNPSGFAAGNANNIVMWEFSSKDDDRLGQSYSAPVIGLMNNGRWAAIFGNGYNAPGTKNAQLFIVYLDGGLNGQWREGQDYIVLNTKVGSNGQPNGMASPAAVDLDGNGTIDRIYAGDLSGNMWAVDTSSSIASNWDFAYSRGSNPRPLFNSPGNDIAITTKPTVAINPVVSTANNNEPNTIVMFGTGQLLASSDKSNTETQTFYGIWDHGEDNINRSDLVEQTFTTTGDNRILTDNSVSYQAGNPGQTKEGWYIDFTGGERIVTNPATRNGLVFFNTTIPDISNPCSFGGSGWLMIAKVENGGQPDEVVVDVNNDDQLTDDDMINGNVVSGIKYESGVPSESSFLGDQLYTATSSGQLERKKIIDVGVKEGRISWKELERD